MYYHVFILRRLIFLDCPKAKRFLTLAAKKKQKRFASGVCFISSLFCGRQVEKGAKPWNGEPQYGAASIGAKVRVWWAGLGQFIDGYIMAYDAERRQSRFGRS